MDLLDRRSFIKESAKAAAGIYLAGGIMPLACQNTKSLPKANVGLIRSRKVWNNNKLNQSIIYKMINRGIRSVTQYDSDSKAWNSLFVPNDIVALKVNCIGKETGSTKPELAYALAQCLHDYVNIPFENIIIFDRTDKELMLAGYKINRSGQGIQVYETPGFSAPLKSGDVLSGVSEIITKKCTALINLPLLKTHSGAKITLSLKNHYGSIPTDVVQSDGKFERIVHVNNLAPIRDKARLCIADGLVAQYDKGPKGIPEYQWKYSGIIMGADPVAVDTIGLNVINEKRKMKNLHPVKAQYIGWASEEGLGVGDSDFIKLSQEMV